MRLGILAERVAREGADSFPKKRTLADKVSRDAISNLRKASHQISTLW
ncbi:hypothetical protein KKC1_05980 [Calderihabitans maritimus]|uniref:Uncharacterized protein n=1 Tax=Calderihabitans maritimus TaxID=1246530 RepID=A0A1Z5HPH7_9FIRM|nr:hypothetical protein KKC1_05980 [Calderihabitans maritimus]